MKVVVASLVAIALAGMAGTLSAQEEQTPAYIGVVNGASSDPVDVTADGIDIATALDYAADGVAATVPPDDYSITFTGGSVDSSVDLELDPGFAYTVVSGFGEDGATAAAYEIDLSPIDQGMARIRVWNATLAEVDAMIGSNQPVTLAPGRGTEVFEVGADTQVEVVVGGVGRTITAAGDSHTDVFRVDDGSQPMLALSVVDSMTDLIDTLYPTVSGSVAVPDVSGQTADDAVAALVAAGFTTETFDVPSDDVARGRVVRTVPAAGIEVPPGFVVVLVVSSGPPPDPEPEDVEIPDVAGLTAEEAEDELVDAGFRVRIREEPSVDVAAGVALGTEPPAGRRRALGATVTLVVSAGPATVVVPDVVGFELSEATAILEASGFAVSAQESTDPDIEAGVVISSNPAAGIEVAPGSTVTITVSIGPQGVQVPALVGLTVDEAIEAARSVGLSVSFVEDQNDPDPNGVVIDQEPEPGELVAPGTEIVALLSPAISEAWTSLSRDASGLLTVAGINFLPGSTVELTVLPTNLFEAARVETDGTWVVVFDLADVDDERLELLVVGTTAEATDYRRTFLIPAAGEVTDEPVEGGSQWWVWVLVVGSIVAVGVLVWWFASRATTPVAPVSGVSQTVSPDDPESPWHASFSRSEPPSSGEPRSGGATAPRSESAAGLADEDPSAGAGRVVPEDEGAAGPESPREAE